MIYLYVLHQVLCMIHFITYPKWSCYIIKNVRADNRRIVQFDINNMTIQENTDYRETASTIETLNKYIVLDEEGYFCHGQSILRLAFEYYERNYNKEYKSELSPQIADIFNGTSSKNTSFNIT